MPKNLAPTDHEDAKAQAEAAEKTSAEATTGQAPDNSDPEDPDGAGTEMSVEDYQRELEKVRREAAKYRTERNELRPLAQKAQEAEDANKTELEKAQERIAALEAEKTQAEQSATRAAVASATGVPAEFIHGETEEQMTEYAARLSEAFEAKSEKGKRPLHVDAVGRQSDPPSDRESFARGFFGRNT